MDELWYFVCAHGVDGAVCDGVVYLFTLCIACEGALASAPEQMNARDRLALIAA